jgi:hypothetical protein
VPPLVLKGHGARVCTLAFSPDGKTLATGSNDQTVRLWDVNTGAAKGLFHPDPGLITGVAFSRDGKTLATTSNQRNLKLWDSSSLEPKAAAVHAEAQQAVVFLPERQSLATAAQDGAVTIWSWDGAKLEAKHTFQLGSNTRGLAVAPDETALAAGCWNGKLVLWDLATLNERSVLAHASPINAVSFSPDGKKLASVAPKEKLIKVWDVETLENPVILQGHRERIYSLAFSPDGTLVLAGGDWSEETNESTKPGEVKLWDVTSRRELASLTLPVGCVFCARFSPDGKTLATAHSDGTARLWDVETILAEAAGSAVEQMQNGLFVILGLDGQPKLSFATLADAVAGARGGDTIEIRGDGPFAIELIRLTIPLTIRAGPGCRPVLKPISQGEKDVRGLLDARARLVLEGLEFQSGKEHFPAGDATALHALAVPLQVANCRFVGGGLMAQHSPDCQVRNCQFRSGSLYLHSTEANNRWVLENNVLLSPNREQGIVLPVTARGQRLTLTRNVVVAENAISLYSAPRKPEDEPLRIQASQNILAGRTCAFLFHGYVDGPTSAEVEDLLRQVVIWREDRNLYPEDVGFLKLTCGQKTIQPLRPSRPYQTLAAWEAFCGLKDTGSLQGRILLQPDPADGRLEPGSAGKGAGPDGKDLGADVDLVGPGAAYERWKQTPEYQRWLWETGQMK